MQRILHSPPILPSPQPRTHAHSKGHCCIEPAEALVSAVNAVGTLTRTEVDGAWNRRDRGNNLLVASDKTVRPLAGLPKSYRQTTISDARVFTDDRGWTGHR